MCSSKLCNVISKILIHMYRRDDIYWYLSADTSKISWSRVSVVCCSHSYCFYNTFSWVYLWQECVTLMVNCTTKHQHKAVQGSVDRNTVTPEDHPSRAQFLSTPKSKESSCCQPPSICLLTSFVNNMYHYWRYHLQPSSAEVKHMQYVVCT